MGSHYIWVTMWCSSTWPLMTNECESNAQIDVQIDVQIDGSHMSAVMTCACKWDLIYMPSNHISNACKWDFIYVFRGHTYLICKYEGIYMKSHLHTYVTTADMFEAIYFSNRWLAYVSSLSLTHTHTYTHTHTHTQTHTHTHACQLEWHVLHTSKETYKETYTYI